MLISVLETEKSLEEKDQGSMEDEQFSNLIGCKILFHIYSCMSRDNELICKINSIYKNLQN